MRKATLLLCSLLLWAAPARADTITGTFVEQTMGCSGAFCSPGTLTEMETASGAYLRYVLVAYEGWSVIPYDYQWVTHENAWSWDGTTLSQVGGVPLDFWTTPERRALLDLREAFIGFDVSGSELKVSYKGYEIGSGTVTQSLQSASVPEPAAWVLMVSGIGMLWRGLAARFQQRKSCPS